MRLKVFLDFLKIEGDLKTQTIDFVSIAMNISTDESEQREGFIVLLDVLGSRGYWLRNEPKLVVKNFSEIVETIEY